MEKDLDNNNNNKTKGIEDILCLIRIQWDYLYCFDSVIYREVMCASLEKENKVN